MKTFANLSAVAKLWPKLYSTRPKPAYGRQGLDWMVGQGYSFVVFSTNKTMETNQKSKNVTLLTWGPNWPPLFQKRYITNRGPQPASFDPKTLCYQHGALTGLLWSKNVTLLTRGPNWPPLIQKRYVTNTGSNRPFRCLDLRLNLWYDFGKMNSTLGSVVPLAMFSNIGFSSSYFIPIKVFPLLIFPNLRFSSSHFSQSRFFFISFFPI